MCLKLNLIVNVALVLSNFNKTAVAKRRLKIKT